MMDNDGYEPTMDDDQVTTAPQIPEEVNEIQVDATADIDPGVVERPTHIPEKFWDTEAGEIRTDSLLKSYQELERRFGSRPESADDYMIETIGTDISINPDVNARLHAAGLTNEQAQVVYSLAESVLQPMANNLAGNIAIQRDVDWLASQHGGSEKWQTIAPQVRTWAEAKFPKDVYENLASSREGVSALYQMMSTDEPAIGDRSANTPGMVSEDGLKAMMRDPRYWRDQDPSFVAQVREGFQRLYPD